MVDKFIAESRTLNDYPTAKEEIDVYTLNALNEDFFCEGSDELVSEYIFDVTNKDPEFRIKGFIDKYAVFKNDDLLVMKDYKSGKHKFKGEKKDFNIQAAIYLLAQKLDKYLAQYSHAEIDFLFLRYLNTPDGTLQIRDMDKYFLMGFMEYLAALSVLVNNFTEKDAKANFAWDKGFTEDFGGRVKCGVKYEDRKPVSVEHGDMKTDGTLRYHCSFRFPFKYWAIINAKQEVILTDKNKTILQTKLNQMETRQDLYIIRKEYRGCPKFYENQCGTNGSSCSKTAG